MPEEKGNSKVEREHQPGSPMVSGFEGWLAHLYVFCKGGNDEVSDHSFSSCLKSIIGEAKMEIPTQAA